MDQFEKDSFKYLTKEYEHYPCVFEEQGGHDSTVPDIKVTQKNGNCFYIEAKMPGAQSGQFVLLADDKKEEFIYSHRNKYSINETSQLIMNHMNENYSLYSIAGTKGKSIELNEDILADWIIEYYKSKNVKYVITGVKSNFTIFPIENLPNYFNISATYRMKKSGSSNPTKNNIEEIIELVNQVSSSFEAKQANGKLYIISAADLANKRLYGEKYSYLLKHQSDNEYIVRKLSNTCNSNVIFSLNLKVGAAQQKEHLDMFKENINM